ncbi:MAG: anion transporter [Planctomycetes bacterium]|nr:anion transporter [Planctomycetota bacterium]
MRATAVARRGRAVKENWEFWLTVMWFTLTYAGLALGKLPGLRIDRTGIALVGAALVLATGGLTFDEAAASIDFATLALLLGMMIVVAFLRQAGFFDRLAGWALRSVRRPHGLLAVTMILAGVLSAVLVNDVVCLALTPLVLHLAERLRLDPRPHLIGLAVAANIGSTATLTGNPQNMIIGNLSHIPYLHFAARLTPVAVAGLLIAFAVIGWVYRDALRWEETPDADKEEAEPAARGSRRLGRPHRRLLVKSLAVTLGAITLFCAGAPMEIVALAAAAVLLLCRINPDKIYRQVDWGLLVMFAGLFVVVRAFEVQVVRRWGIEEWGPLQDNPVGLLSVVSAALSNVVSNVPAVLLFKPIIPAMAAGVQETAWLALAMSSTLAGNLTVLGSVANLIVVENARREGVSISFWDYARVGIPVTALTLTLGMAWLHFVPW